MKQSATILIVDNDKSAIKILTKMLTQNGYSTDFCLNGELALDKVRKNEYDLVLLDVKLGKGMDGYEVCQKLKKNANTNSIPVIFLSARAHEKEIQKGFEAGAQGYITKPFRKNDLIQQIEKTLATYKKNAETET